MPTENQVFFGFGYANTCYIFGSFMKEMYEYFA